MTKPARSEDLTPREREVLELMDKGATAKQVGRRLGISARTVEMHMANVLKKLRVHNIRQAGTLLLRSAVALALLFATDGMARDNGQWSQSDPKLRQWFREQKQPKSGIPCCDEADGVQAEEDIRNGEYWARWSMRPRGFDAPFVTEWTRVPDDVVIREPNRYGAPIVWWWIENGQPAVRCYAPGAGI